MNAELSLPGSYIIINTHSCSATVEGLTSRRQCRQQRADTWLLRPLCNVSVFTVPLLSFLFSISPSICLPQSSLLLPSAIYSSFLSLLTPVRTMSPLYDYNGIMGTHLTHCSLSDTQTVNRLCDLQHRHHSCEDCH